MQFHVLRETPENSGSFVATGEVLDVPADVAVDAVLNRQVTEGGRHAIFPYDSIRRERPAAPARVSVPDVTVDPVLTSDDPHTA